MKNTLLTTTALALTSLAGTASAVEVAAGAVNLNIGGDFRTTVAASSVKTGAGAKFGDHDYDGVDILTSSEIHFKPSIVLDNGIKIGADVELEGNTSGDQIDESTIFAIGGFGRLELGSKDSAGKNMQVGAPDVSMVYANSTSLTAFVPFTGPGTFFDFAGDADRLTYFTPDFGGFQLGVSYARNNSQTNGAVNNNADGIGTDYADIGVTYSGTVGDVAVSLSARYGTYSRGMRPNAAFAAMTASTAAALQSAKAVIQSDTAALYTAAAAAESLPVNTDDEITARNVAIADANAAGVLSAAMLLPVSTPAEITIRNAAIAAANAAQDVLKYLTLTAPTPTESTAGAELFSEAAITATNNAITATNNAALQTIATASRTFDEIALDDAASAGAHPTVAGVGLKLGFGDFSVGGGYVEVDEKAGLSEAKTYDIGVSYATGPMAYSLTYVHGKTSDNVAENTSMVAAATYTVNPNFKVGASLASVETDVAKDADGDIKATIFGLSAQFTF